MILGKSKIVLEDDGKTLTIYLWKQSFWIFGHWYPFGVINSSSKIDSKIIDRIDDNLISKALFENVLNEPCEHSEWVMDTQIKTIKCKECGKRAFTKDYENLYTIKN